ncbi:MAG: hypothetical protein ACRD0D_10030, partial [Acidimicrobiales bacterium]
LSDLGRREEMGSRFAEVLAEQAGNPWARGLILAARARWHRQGDDHPAAIGDAVEAAGRITPERDPLARGEVRSFLRALRGDGTGAFDAAWAATIDADQPVWLRHHEPDQSLQDALIEWVRTSSWDDSQAFLAEHAGALLGDRGEASLEHLIDANPARQDLLLHIAVLQAARRDGIEAAYATLRASLERQALETVFIDWIGTRTWDDSRALLAEHAGDLLTDEAEAVLRSLVHRNPDAPDVFAHLGLLGLCRLQGIEVAYDTLRELATPPGGKAPPPSGAAEGPARLATARLRAGLRTDDPSAHLEHAMAAVTGGEQDEAERAIVRFADRSATWERPAAARRLRQMADGHPDLAEAIGQLQLLLTRPSP